VSDDPESETPPAVDPLAPVPPRAGQPLWTAFLTPLAVLLGAALVAGAIWLTDEDEAAPAAVVEVDPGAVTSIDGSSTTPTTLLAALRSYAGQLDLDVDEFEQCLADSGRADVINEHLARGSALGVTGTPTFFINNKMIVGAQPTAVFVEVIEKELSGSPTSIDEYSELVRSLAQTTPPRFSIVDQPIDVSGAAIEGNPNAKVMIAEYSDFQCPFCQRWVQQTLGTIRTQLGDDVALAFLHFPITQIHPNAGYVSFGAICAGEQDRFWEMHDLLFARQKEWQSLPAN